MQREGVNKIWHGFNRFGTSSQFIILSYAQNFQKFLNYIKTIASIFSTTRIENEEVRSSYIISKINKYITN